MCVRFVPFLQELHKFLRLAHIRLFRKARSVVFPAFENREGWGSQVATPLVALADYGASA